MSLLSQLKDLKNQYLTSNAEYLRTPIFLNGGIPLQDDPGKATRRHVIPHYVIWHGLPEPPPYEPEAGADMPDERADMPEEVIA